MHAFLFLALLPFASPSVKETAQTIEVRGPQYVAVIGKSPGGLLRSLRSPDGKIEYAANHMIYTDVGVYGPGRGYVGSRNERAPRVTAQRAGGRVVVTAVGKLRGKLAEGKKLIGYRVVYTFDDSPRIQVLCEATPGESQDQVRAFLASVFVVPHMREWAALTINGVVRQDRRAGRRRSYQSKHEPLDARRPMLGFINDDGSSLLVSDIRWEGPTPLQDIIIHGRAVFFAWFDGIPARLAAQPYRVRFTLTLGRGDPMK